MTGRNLSTMSLARTWVLIAQTPPFSISPTLFHFECPDARERQRRHPAVDPLPTQGECECLAPLLAGTASPGTSAKRQGSVRTAAERQGAHPGGAGRKSGAFGTQDRIPLHAHIPDPCLVISEELEQCPVEV